MKTMDPAQLQALIELNDDTGGTLIFEMIDGYRVDLPKRLPTLLGHFTARRSEEFVFEAHAMKSTFANFAALRIASICQQLETFGRAQDWARAELALKELKSEIIVFESDLEELQRDLNDPQRKRVS